MSTLNIFISETYIRKEFYEKYNTKFSTWFPGISGPLKSGMSDS